MTLRELRYLVTLADCRHFGRAAAACGVSQPTLSTQLKKLEAFLGVTLFERTNKSLNVTPIGAEIIARARRVLAEAEAIVDVARAPLEPLSGALNLGVIPTLSPYLLPWLLPAVHAGYPKAQLVIHEDLTDNLIARLKDHTVDAALLALPIDHPEFVVQALFDEPFFFACPQDHRLATARHVSQSDMRHSNLLLLTDGHCLRDQALAVCGTDTPDGLNTDLHATSLETIRQMVVAGMGCTLLPAMSIGDHDASPGQLRIRPIAGDAARRIGLVWRRTYPKAADLQRLAEVITANLPSSVRAVE